MPALKSVGLSFRETAEQSISEHRFLQHQKQQKLKREELQNENTINQSFGNGVGEMLSDKRVELFEISDRSRKLN